MKNIIITGANRGIGLALCTLYSQQQAQVFAVCRKASNELKKLDVQIIENVDISNDQQIAHLKHSLKNINIGFSYAKNILQNISCLFAIL